MRKLIIAFVFLMIAAFAFAQDHNNSSPGFNPKTQQDFSKIQRTFKVDQISFDNQNWQNIEPPKSITVTATMIITPDQDLKILTVIQSPTGDYLITFVSDPQVYVFDLHDGLILVGTSHVLNFILHIQKIPAIPTI